MYYYIEPEVAGGFGPNTVMDTSSHPPKVSKLHFQFDGWLGDELLETFPCYLVTHDLARALEAENLQGFELADVEVSTSEQFESMHHDTQLPDFYWLKIIGVAMQDDLGIADDFRLVLSQKALNTINTRSLTQADIEAC